MDTEERTKRIGAALIIIQENYPLRALQEPEEQRSHFMMWGGFWFATWVIHLHPEILGKLMTDFNENVTAEGGGIFGSLADVLFDSWEEEEDEEGRASTGNLGGLRRAGPHQGSPLDFN